jgi:hypothetical protein
MDLRSLLRRLGGSADPLGGTAGPSPAGGSASSSPSAAAAPGPAPVPVERPRRPAWRDAPPIQRSVAPAPLTARTVDFARDLTAHQPAPLALEPLGHEVHADAPSGRVSGLATIRPASTHAAEHGPLQASVRAGGVVPEAMVEPAPPARLAGRPLGSGGGAGAEPSAASSAPAGRSAPARPAEPTTRPAPAVSRSTGEGRSLIRAADARVEPPAGVIGRAQRAGTPAPSAAVTAAPAPVAATVQSSSLVLPVPTTPPASPSSTPAPSLTSHVALDAPRAAGTGRRIRIGAPIDGSAAEFRMIGRQPAADHAEAPPAPAAFADRAVRPPSEPGLHHPAPEAPALQATSRRTTVQRLEDDKPDGPGASEMPTSVPILAASGAPIPVALRPAAPRPVERPLVGGLRAGAGRGTADARTEAPAQRSGTGTGASPAARTSTQPSVADIVASLAAGGSMAAGAPSADREARPSRLERGPDPTIVPAARPAPLAIAGGWPEPVAIAATGASHAAPVRSASADPTSWQPPIRRVATRPGRTPGGLAATGSTAPDRPSAAAGATVQRASASPTAGGSHPTARTATSAPTALEVLLGAGSAEAADDGAAPPSSSPGDLDDGLNASAPASAGPILQASAAATSGGSSLHAAGATEGAAGGTSDKELDELARKLFPRLQNRLRSELLVDRERIGALVDFSR